VKTKLVCVQLETCHANHDGTAWYAYFDGKPKDVEDGAWSREIEKLAKKDGAPLGIEVGDYEEVPTALSKHTGLLRYYVGAAV
jgi:hypothetical protein